MKRNLDALKNGTFDLLIVGGGINGAATAHLAAKSGLRTVLIEKADFASGTSSKSTKLIHGGLRYLENLELGLVRESLHERAIQMRSAPHLVKPLSFLIPSYKNDVRPLWKMKAGVWLYDLLAGKDKIEKFKSLSSAEISQMIPGVSKEGLLGGVMYYDAQMDDARLCLENVLSAAEHGAITANYVEALEPVKQLGKTVAVRARDVFSGNVFDIKAKKTVCCLGPWTNAFLKKEGGHQKDKVRMTKGVHVVYRARISNHALLFSTSDKRIFFIIPFHGNSLIGTTDTDFHKSPDDVRAQKEDVAYLLKEAQRALPFIPFEEHDIIATFAGLRPLLSQEGDPGHVSRKHQIFESYTGMVYVVGGKYTTYRKIAEDTVRACGHRNVADSHEILPLYGSGEIKESAERVAEEFRVDPLSVQLILDQYGSRYRDVLQLCREDSSLQERICSFSPAIRAQIRYAIDVEMAQTPEDVVTRRLPLSYQGHLTPQESENIKALFNK